MAITFDVQPGYQFSASERVTYSKLNLLGTPGITLDGLVYSSEITDGAVTTQKLASSIDINSKIDDHNLALTKLAQGTHGQILYYDANSDLATLPPGTDGYFLRTKGEGADPEWASQTGLGSVPYTDITTDGVDKYLTTDSSGNIEWINKPNTNSVSVYDTSDLAAIIADGSPYTATQAHGLGVVPEQVVVTLRCTSDDSSNTGYVEGDEILLSGTHCNKASSQGEIPAASAIVDSTNVVVQVTDEVLSNASKFLVYRKSDATQVGIGSSANKFVFRIRAWKSGFASSGTNAGPLTSDPGYYFSGLSSGSAGDYIFATTAADRQVVFNHGLGSVPKLVRSVLVATSDVSELGLVTGDEVNASDLIYGYRDSQYEMVQTKATTSQVRLTLALGHVGQIQERAFLVHHSTNVTTGLTSAMMSKMKFKLYAWK